MNSAARWKRITAHPLFNPLANPLPILLPIPPREPSPDPLPDSPDPSPNLSAPSSAISSADSSPLLKERVRAIFPLGFESNSTSIKKQPYSYTPDLLLETLSADHSGNQHVEHTFVKSAWYGKQKKSARHEFIVLQVGDTKIPNLDNFIALDRNQGTPTSSSNVSASSRSNASDAFRVSYDGDLHRFLRECQLTDYLKLEQIHFQANEPLLLLDLVTLVAHISEHHPIYSPVDTNCYWYTGLVWECMRKMRPKASHVVHVEGQKGRIAFARVIPNPVQVWSILREVQITMPLLSAETPADPNCLPNDVGEDIATVMVQTGTEKLAAMEIVGADVQPKLRSSLKSANPPVVRTYVET